MSNRLCFARIVFSFLLIIFFSTIAYCQASDTAEVRELIKLAQGLKENHPDSMLGVVNKGLILAERIDDHMGLIELTLLKGSYYWFKSDYLLAIEEYNRALALSRAHNKPQKITNALTNLGQAYSKLGDYSKAIDYFLKSIALGDSLGFDNRLTYNSLGVAYKRNSNYDLALSAIQESIKIERSKPTISGVSGLLGGVYANLGSIYLEMDSLDKSLEYEEKAIQIFDSLGQTRGLVVAYNNLAAVLIKQNKTDQATTYSQKALALSRENQLFSSEALALLALADIAKMKENYTQAIGFLQSAIAIAEIHGHSEELVRYYGAIASCYELAKEYDQATEFYKKYGIMKDSVFSQESLNKIANLRVAYEINKRDKDVALLNKEQELILLNRNISIYISSGLIILLIIVVLFQYSANKKKKMLILQKEIIHKTKQELMEIALENQQLKQDDLEKELDHKAKELTTHALHILQKNQLLGELKEGLSKLDTSESDTKQSIRKLISTINFSHHQDSEWLTFKAHFEEVNQGFFDRVMKRFPDFTSNDMKICALAKLNLDTKEIASILGISGESAKMARYRLRKKMKLEPDQNLVAFLASI